ncbi:MAG TPA: response regulator transcription factor [Candidatus Dormibacteraeota bacterium]|jgi:DNA-binding response OmpR family regulator
MRVLVVEDDAGLAESLHRGLEELGMAIDTASDEQETLAAISGASYDVLVLDVMLPGRDGMAIATGLRRRGVKVPILMLTARAGVEDRVKGLEAGADDYLVKPFAPAELVARIRALARRHLPERTAVLNGGPIELDTGAHRVLVHGSEVAFTGKEFALLELFMLHRGQLLSRERILDSVWDFDLEDGRNLVEVYIGRLRRKLVAAGAGDPITTFRGVGYRFQPAG